MCFCWNKLPEGRPGWWGTDRKPSAVGCVDSYKDLLPCPEGCGASRETEGKHGERLVVEGRGGIQKTSKAVKHSDITK